MLTHRWRMRAVLRFVRERPDALLARRRVHSIVTLMFSCVAVLLVQPYHTFTPCATCAFLPALLSGGV